ncbi:MAG: lipopolysaccharide biosynthesis protein [Sphingomonadales bacterium]|nr:lipopolysaccharide biosynthesis protein [Sphingomonadales bacterium]
MHIRALIGGNQDGGAQAPFQQDMTGQPELQHLTVRQLWQILRRHRMLVGLIVGISLLVTIMTQILATPVYEATATLQVELTDNAGANQAEIAARNQQRVANEARTYSSRALAEAVVRDLNLIRDKRFMNAPAVLTGKESDDLIREATSKLQETTRIESNAQSDFIDIIAHSSSADLAARIANQFPISLRKQKHNDRDKRRQRVVVALDEATQSLAREVSTAEQRVADFRRAHGMLTGAGGVEDLQQLNRIATETASASGMQAAMAARSAGLSRAASLHTTAGATSPLLQQQQIAYDNLMREKAKLSGTYGPDHPDMVNIGAQISELTAAMNQERAAVIAASQAVASTAAAREAQIAQSEAASATARAGQLQSRLGLLTSKAYQNTSSAVDLNVLERKAEVARQVYLETAGRAQAVSAELLTTGVNSSLVSPAVAAMLPISPAPKKAIVSALFGSLMLSFLLVFGLEMFDNRLRTGDQITRLFGLPTFAMFPLMLQDMDMAPDESPVIREPQSLFAEVARSFHAEVAQLAVDGGAQSVLITSPLPGDGKSTIALSLVAAASAMGRRAIVVDLDLRRPGVLHRIQQQSDGPDLVDYLTGSVDPQKLLPVPSEAGGGRTIATFHPAVLSSREPVLDPASLVRVSHINAMFAQLRSQFDLIVINAPATLAVRDARTLVDVADSTIMVVNWSTTTIEQTRAALLLLHNKVAGIVFNKVDYAEHARRGYGDAVEFYSESSSYYTGYLPRSRDWLGWVRNGLRWPKRGAA